VIGPLKAYSRDVVNSDGRLMEDWQSDLRLFGEILVPLACGHFIGSFAGSLERAGESMACLRFAKSQFTRMSDRCLPRTEDRRACPTTELKVFEARSISCFGLRRRIPSGHDGSTKPPASEP